MLWLYFLYLIRIASARRCICLQSIVRGVRHPKRDACMGDAPSGYHPNAERFWTPKGPKTCHNMVSIMVSVACSLGGAPNSLAVSTVARKKRFTVHKFITRTEDQYSDSGMVHSPLSSARLNFPVVAACALDASEFENTRYRLSKICHEGGEM
jgi:hypothetical protein